jgi:hypothetical protein
VPEAWVFLVELGFKVHRGFEAEGAVEPLAVVKDFDPSKMAVRASAWVTNRQRWIRNGGGEPRRPHQPGDPMPATPLTVLVHAGTAIGLAAFPMRLFNERQQSALAPPGARLAHA